MDKSERQKIYTLLSKFFPQAKQLKDRETLTAWGIVLEDYTYDDVKTAVLRYATKNKFFPDLADITGSLTPILSTVPEEITDSSRHKPPGPKELASMEWLKALVDSWGGPCPIIHDSTGMCGLALRRSVPAGCEGCRVLRVNWSCHRREQVLKEQANCRILLQYRGTASQEHLLEDHWQVECPNCETPCFWFRGKLMEVRNNG